MLQILFLNIKMFLVFLFIYFATHLNVSGLFYHVYIKEALVVQMVKSVGQLGDWRIKV